jgi:uncharacterized repeat protein (TIGR04138 family)
MSRHMPPALSATKYPFEAFDFVRKGLEHAANKVHGNVEPGQTAASRHITGQQLCIGLRDFAIAEYGLMARTVLRRWRITSTEDFGHIVFALVEAKHLSTTEGDSIRDFVDIFRFEDAFPAKVCLPDPKD